jgi:hypothetical protein
MNLEIIKILEEESIYGNVHKESFEDVANKIVDLVKEKMGDNYVKSKLEKIKEIKEYVSNNSEDGEIAIANLDVNLSITIESVGKTKISLDKLFENKVGVETFVGCMLINNSYMSYEDLSDEVLDSIIDIF